MSNFTHRNKAKTSLTLSHKRKNLNNNQFLLHRQRDYSLKFVFFALSLKGTFASLP